MKRKELLKIIQETIKEGQYKVDGHIFNKVYTSEGTAFIGDDGVLGSNNKLIPWDSIMQYYKKVNKESYMYSGDSSMRTEGAKKFSPRQVQSAVDKVKKALIKRWKTKGAYENFGVKELRKLEDKFVDISSYTDEMNQIRDILQRFSDWAGRYNGNEQMEEVVQEDFVEKGISSFFKKLRDKKQKKEIDAFLEKDPDLKKALDTISKKNDEFTDLLSKFATK